MCACCPHRCGEPPSGVGRAYRVHFRTLDGRDHEASSEFLEVIPPRRIVMSWGWAFGGEFEESARTSQVEIGARADR
jgi:uncharacterized protein YndB with AHSA1/START domain